MELDDKIKSIAIRAKILGNNVEVLDSNTILIKKRDNLGYILYYLKNNDVEHKEFKYCNIRNVSKAKYLCLTNLHTKYTSVVDYNANIVIDETVDYVGHIHGDFFKIDVTSTLIRVINCRTKKETYPEYTDMIVYEIDNKCTFIMIKQLAVDIYNNDLDLICKYSVAGTVVHRLLTVYDKCIQLGTSDSNSILIDHKGNELCRLSEVKEYRIQNKELKKAIRIY